MPRSANNRVRVLPPGGAISTIEGTMGAASCGDDGAASSSVAAPFGVCLDDAANQLYVLEGGCSRVRRIDLSAATIATVVGTVRGRMRVAQALRVGSGFLSLRRPLL
jgi:hypothetical protein